MNTSNYQLIIITLLSVAVRSGTVILFPTIGEIFTERSGVLNLGLEGIMLISAFVAFIVAFYSNNPYIGFLIGILTGGIISLLHSYICITLYGNQVVSGLAISIFGSGFTNFYGSNFANLKLDNPLKSFPIPYLSKIPIIGQIFFNQDIIVYFSYILVPVMWFLLYKTKIGINLRAVGENAIAANAMGVDVYKTRYLWTIFGGLLAGAGGSYLTVGYAPFWMDGITAGRGWIAVALVIFSMWNPLISIIGAYLFGSLDALQFQLQVMGTKIAPSFLAMIPYLTTLIIIIITTVVLRVKRIGVPKELGKPFFKEEK
ncbi:MAG: ABC transporter permease [Caldisericia bacterium]|jgi:simple sugar transport system permease protein|nr:ABC transporter permease [Caldisericia bacterium]